MIPIFSCKVVEVPSGTGDFLRLLVGELVTPKLAKIFTYGKWLYPYIMRTWGIRCPGGLFVSSRTPVRVAHKQAAMTPVRVAHRPAAMTPVRVAHKQVSWWPVCELNVQVCWRPV